MIYVDSTEMVASSRLPKIPHARAITGLEALCGADILISPLQKTPKSGKMVQRHLKAGALLVQRKSTADLAQSMQDERLYRQITRMRQYNTSTHQCVLVFAGMFVPNRKGKLRIGKFDGTQIRWRHTRLSYAAFRARLNKLADTVRVVQLCHDEEIAAWAVERERHVKEYASGADTKLVHDKPLREMRMGNEYWYPLTMFDQCGMVKARAVGEHLTAIGCGTLAYALEYLSNVHNATLPRPRGVGIRTWCEIRAGLGLEENQVLKVVDRSLLASLQALIDQGENT